MGWEHHPQVDGTTRRLVLATGPPGCCDRCWDDDLGWPPAATFLLEPRIRAPGTSTPHWPTAARSWPARQHRWLCLQLCSPQHRARIAHNAPPPQPQGCSSRAESKFDCTPASACSQLFQCKPALVPTLIQPLRAPLTLQLLPAPRAPVPPLSPNHLQPQSGCLKGQAGAAPGPPLSFS